MKTRIEHDETDMRIILMVDGQAGGYIMYEIYDGCLDIQHTVVNRELRGHGLGQILIKAAVDYAKDKSLDIKPTCSYAQKLLS